MGFLSDTFVPGAPPAEEVAPGMGRISFADDFTSFDDLFPDAELAPSSTGVGSLDEIKAGFSSPSGQWRINIDDMVTAGADADFTAIVYLTGLANAQFTMSAVFQIIGFDAPRAQIMLGAYHLDGDPAVPVVPPNVTNFGTQGPFGGVGVGRNATGRRIFQSRFEGDTPSSAAQSLEFTEGSFAVDTFGFGTRIGVALGSSLAALDGGTTWSNQTALGLRNPSMSDTHILRPCLIIRKENVVNTTGYIDVRRLDFLYNIRT